MIFPESERADWQLFCISYSSALSYPEASVARCEEKEEPLSPTNLYEVSHLKRDVREQKFPLADEFPWWL